MSNADRQNYIEDGNAILERFGLDRISDRLCDVGDFIVIYYVVQVLIARFAFVKELKGLLFRILEATRHEICDNTVVTHKIGVANIAYVEILIDHVNVRVNYEMAIFVAIRIGFAL